MTAAGEGKEHPLPQEPPRISVIIPVRPTETVSAAVESLKSIDYPEDRFEVIVIPGRSPSRQRNAGVRRAAGDILYFLDNDSQADRKLFRHAVQCFDDDRIAGAGGPNAAAGNPGSFTAAMAERVLTSRLGTGRIKARYTPVGEKRFATERELIFCNLAIRKAVLNEVGGICETLYPNEENELISRITTAPYNYRMVYSPDVVVYRKRPRSMWVYFRTIFRYGRGRVRQTFTRPKLNCLPHFAPLGLLAYLVALPFFAKHLLAFAPLAAYVALLIVGGLRFAFTEKNFAAVPAGALMLAGTHISYALGLLGGLLTAPFSSTGTPAEAMEAHYVKTFDGWVRSDDKKNA